MRNVRSRLSAPTSPFPSPIPRQTPTPMPPPAPPLPRPSYYMGHRHRPCGRRAELPGSRGPAILVLDDRIIATGYNATPRPAGRTADDGACEALRQPPKRYQSGPSGLTICAICRPHARAERRCRAAAPLRASPLRRDLLTPPRAPPPCFGCHQGACCRPGARGALTLHDWNHPDASLPRRCTSAFRPEASPWLQPRCGRGTPNKTGPGASRQWKP